MIVNNGIGIMDCLGVFQDPDGTFWTMDTCNTSIDGAMSPGAPFILTGDRKDNEGQEWHRLVLNSSWGIGKTGRPAGETRF